MNASPTLIHASRVSAQKLAGRDTPFLTDEPRGIAVPSDRAGLAMRRWLYKMTRPDQKL